MKDLIDAAQTFRDHEILITGANGFVGKVILALLFDRFPDLKHLHILVRPRAGATARERFEKDVLSSPPLRKFRAPERITIHSGDIAETLCGLGPDAVAALSGRVRLIINCAGLVEFFPPVDESFRSNVDGVENVIALAKRLPAKLVHVSTCFVCGEADGLVEETEPIPGFYPRRKGPDDHSFRHRQEIQFMRERVREVYDSGRSSREEAREIAQRLVDLGTQRAAQWGWVNIYTYAKSLGEQLIAGEPDLDWAIVRPAIVEAALEFPFPGWVEGGRTAAPLVIMAMSGLRHWPVRPDAPMEVVPVDQVAASILTTSVLLLNGESRRVYHLGTADVNPVPLGKIVRWMHQESGRRPRRGMQRLRLPLGVRILSPRQARERRQRIQRRFTALQHAVVGLKKMVQRAGLPGRRALGALGVTLRALGLQVMFREQMLELYQPFILDNRFVFEAENIRRARARLSEKDRALLPWTPEKIDWRHYWLRSEVEGIMKWVEPEMMKGRTVKA